MFGPASRVFYEQFLSYLERGQRVLLWLGLVLIVVGWFAGRTAPATAARSTVTSGLESVGSAFTDTLSSRAGPMDRSERRGCAMRPAHWEPWSCSGATTSPSRGCSGR